jgi:signal transduction histidine kinase
LNALARLDEGEEMAFSTINLSDITNSTCEPFINSFKAQNKELILNITDDITIKGNEASIRKLISIILDNALKYSLSRAQVEVKKQGERIIFLERNDALNFENGIHDEVFGRFFRSDDARGSEIEGTGIGLSIAKEIATMHKAKIMSYGEEGDFVIKVEF